MRMVCLALACMSGLLGVSLEARAETPTSALPGVPATNTLARPYRTIRLSGHEVGTHSFALSGTGARAACCYRRGFIKVWEAGTGRVVATLTPEDDNRAGRPSYLLALDSSGSRLASGAVAESFCTEDLFRAQRIRRGTQVRLWDVAEQKTIRVFHAAGKRPAFLAIGSDGGQVSWCDFGLTARLCDARSGGEKCSIDPPPLCSLPNPIIPGFWDASGDATRVVVVVAAERNRFRILACDLRNGRSRIVQPEDETKSCDCVSITPDGRKLAVVSGNIGGARELKILDFETGRSYCSRPLSDDTPHDVLRFSPHGELLAMAGDGGRISLIASDNGAPLGDIPADGKATRAIAFVSKNRLRVLCGGEDLSSSSPGRGECKPLCVQDYKLPDF